MHWAVLSGSLTRHKAILHSDLNSATLNCAVEWFQCSTVLFAINLLIAWFSRLFASVGEGGACCHNFHLSRSKTGYDWAIKKSKTVL